MARERKTETVVIGGGQAGLALSRSLSLADSDHVVLERGRVGERWRSERWDSLTLLTPNWMSALPGLPHDEPNGFLSRAEFVDYLERYARRFDLPLQQDTSVIRVAQAPGGFAIETDRNAWHARNVVIATGDGATPRLPSLAAEAPTGVLGLHASRYRSPSRLPDGGVLVVGAGPSGQQIALELAESGRDVWLAVGRHARAPRRYRGADIWRWLEAMGHLEETVDDLASGASWRTTPSMALSGAHGGRRLDLGVLQGAGVSLTGRVEGFDGTRAFFADDLERRVTEADRRLGWLLTRIDAHVERAGIRGAAADPPPAVEVDRGPDSLDLRAAGVGTIVWATGFGRSYPWLRVRGVGSDSGLAHRRGVTPVRGLFVLGLRLQHRRSSHMIGGVGRDAEHIAMHILEPAAERLAAAFPARQPRPTLTPAPALGYS